MTAVQELRKINVDRTFDPNETCARCGPSTQAQFRWVFQEVSKFTHEHSELYLCAHCSSVGERGLLSTSILDVPRTESLALRIRR
jgi:hypothetical protein